MQVLVRAPIILAVLCGLGYALEGALSVRNPTPFRFFLVPLGNLGGLYIIGGLLKWTGTWIGGQASAEDLRAASAWSQVPVIASQILSISILALLGGEFFGRETPTIGANPLLVDGFAGIVLGLKLWAFVIWLKCVGEAQNFSAWKSLANISMAGAVIVIAAIGLIITG